MSNLLPVKLAHLLFEPTGGADESLNPVIFLHGVTASKEDWGGIPKTVADELKRKVYALDARNHADSGYSDSFNFDLNVDDLFHFMDNINAQKAVIVGHSMGGITAIKSALRNPERVEAIIVEDMFTKKVPPHIMEPIVGVIQLWIAGLQTVPKDFSKDEAIQHCAKYLYENLPEDSPLREMFNRAKAMEINIEFKRTEDGRYDVNYNREVILAALKRDNISEEPSGQFQGPAYFLYGGDSPFQVGKEEEHIKTFFPKAELIEFEGAMHDIHLECEEKFKEALLKLLR